MITTIQRNLLYLLSLPLALSACTADVATPTDSGLLPSGDPVPVRISSAICSDYGSYPASTRSGNKVLLSEQVMIEDEWASPASTRSPGYVPTPTATLTLTEESASDTRAAKPGEMEPQKEFFLICYQRNAEGGYDCRATRTCMNWTDGTIRFLSGEGCTGGEDFNSWFLPAGTYRFVGVYIPQIRTNNIFPYLDLDNLPWGATITQRYDQIIADDQQGILPHHMFLYDSGDLVVGRVPVSLNIVFRPAFCRMKVTVDCQELYQHMIASGQKFDERDFALYIAPDVYYWEDMSWTIGNNTINYVPMSYPSGIITSDVYQVISQEDGLYEFEFLNRPLSDTPLHIPYQNPTSTEIRSLITIPEIRTRGNVTLEPGKSYHLKLVVNPRYVQIHQTGKNEIDDLWWLTEYVDGGKFFSVDQAKIICSTLDPNLYGSGWRLPTKSEITALAEQLTVDSKLSYIKARFPVLWFANSGYKSSVNSGVVVLPNPDGPTFPSSDITSSSVWALSGKEAKSFTISGGFGASCVQCVKGPKH